jgi:beta-xylosidase
MVGPGGRTVRAYTSKDLVNWTGPTVIYRAPNDVWGDIPIVSIWAPEMHYYKGKYYLFLTFDTRHQLAEQWRRWVPRVTRGSTILWSDSPNGPFTSFQPHSTPPPDMMTLDGTFWVEDAVPYMVFAHEWVQIVNGGIEYIKLKEDLSAAVGEPMPMFHGGDAPWSKSDKRYANHVTDGPYLRKSKSGKLFMVWTSGGNGGYTTGIAISPSGKLAGPWEHQPEPLFAPGGHPMLFETFKGKIMMVLHSPNNMNSQPHIFEMEDTGDTLKLVKEFRDTNP